MLNILNLMLIIIKSFNISSNACHIFIDSTNYNLLEGNILLHGFTCSVISNLPQLNMKDEILLGNFG